jgi:hypothetical protein
MSSKSAGCSESEPICSLVRVGLEVPTLYCFFLPQDFMSSNTSDCGRTTERIPSDFRSDQGILWTHTVAALGLSNNPVKDWNVDRMVRLAWKKTGG